MANPDIILRKVSGHTKAYMIVNEFLSGNLPLPEVKELMNLLATSDLERIGILELVRQQLVQAEVDPEERDLLLGGLTGAGGAGDTNTGETSATPQRQTLTVVPFQRKTSSTPRPHVDASPGTDASEAKPEPKPGPKPKPPATGPSSGRTPPPKPPPLYPGQGERAPRRTGTIPAPKEVQATQPAPAPRKGETFFGSGAAAFAPVGPSVSAKPRILVADDDPRIRMIFRMKLQKAGYNVIEAHNGEAAWRAIENESPAGMVMDMKMPGLHGLEILARLTQQGSQLPVLVCSAYDQLKDEFVIKNYPCIRYFVKPVNADELVTALQEFVPIPDA